MIIERKLSKWESRNFTRVRKLSPKETQRFYSQLYEQREYAMGLGFLSKGLGKIGSGFSSFGKSAGNLNTKIGGAGGTGQVFKNIGSNIKTGFENTGTKIKNWWNSGPSAYESSSMYNARVRSGVGPQQAQTKEYKSIFSPQQKPATPTPNVSTNANSTGADKSLFEVPKAGQTPAEFLKNGGQAAPINQQNNTVVGAGSTNVVANTQTPDPVKKIGTIPQSANINNPAGATFSEQSEFPTRRLFNI